MYLLAKSGAHSQFVSPQHGWQKNEKKRNNTSNYKALCISHKCKKAELKKIAGIQ